MHAGKIHKVFFSVSATTIFLCIYSIAVAAVEKGYFCFLIEVLLLLIIVLLGCAAAVTGACAADNISPEAEKGAGYCFFPPRFCP